MAKYTYIYIVYLAMALLVMEIITVLQSQSFKDITEKQTVRQRGKCGKKYFTLLP